MQVAAFCSKDRILKLKPVENRLLITYASSKHTRNRLMCCRIRRFQTLSMIYAGCLRCSHSLYLLLMRDRSGCLKYVMCTMMGKGSHLCAISRRATALLCQRRRRVRLARQASLFILTARSKNKICTHYHWRRMERTSLRPMKMQSHFGTWTDLSQSQTLSSLLAVVQLLAKNTLLINLLAVVHQDKKMR